MSPTPSTVTTMIDSEWPILIKFILDAYETETNHARRAGMFFLFLGIVTKVKIKQNLVGGTIDRAR